MTVSVRQVCASLVIPLQPLGGRLHRQRATDTGPAGRDATPCPGRTRPGDGAAAPSLPSDSPRADLQPPAPRNGPPEGTARTGAVRLAAVVVTHNRRPQLMRTVARLLDEGVDHLVVVDNASTDGSRDWLASLRDPRLLAVLNRTNAGGAGGFEIGLRTARERLDADWYLVTDDDARPRPGAIAAFRALLARQGAADWQALAAGVFYPDGAICETNRPSRNPFWCWRSFLRTLGAGRAGFHLRDADYAAGSIARVDAASFVGLFLSRRAIELGGYPRGGLFIYGDDVLYTLGLRRRGGRIGFAPWVGFEHDCSTFPRGGIRVHRPLWKIYYTHRNALLAYRAAAGPVLFWGVLPVVLPRWLARLRGYDRSERAAALRLLALAVADGLTGRQDRAHRTILHSAGQPRARTNAPTVAPAVPAGE